MENTLASIILGIAGVILSLIFSYFPVAQKWYDAQSNKGLLMLAFNVIVAGAYFGLSCTPFAAQFHISVSCDQNGVFNMLQALFVMASSNQLTLLFSKSGTPKN
jgi:hypothetical protein